MRIYNKNAGGFSITNAVLHASQLYSQASSNNNQKAPSFKAVRVALIIGAVMLML